MPMAALLALGCAGDDDDASTSAAEVAHGPCVIYVECVQFVDASKAASVDEQFGDEGTCWVAPSIIEEDCWNECAYWLDMYRESHPNAEPCQKCDAATECSEGETCIDEMCVS